MDISLTSLAQCNTAEVRLSSFGLAHEIDLTPESWADLWGAGQMNAIVISLL
jgi:hypothetical protein